MSQKKLQNCPSCGTAHSKKACPPGSVNLPTTVGGADGPWDRTYLPVGVVALVGVAVFYYHRTWSSKPEKPRAVKGSQSFAPMSFGF